MSLAPGVRLGAYEIISPLGAGGMGEVYRARDPRLHRDVAVKILRGDCPASAETRARFEREAHAVAALSHPNILAIHDIGSDNNQLYIVTELLEGETLRARLERGPLPWRKAVEIAAAIADGLAATHIKGIIHRDLKPANIFLTRDGRVKVLDFGIAKLRDAAEPEQLDTTISQNAPGRMLGTVAYMAPEQAAGKTVDARSDLFALGCVLYEMVGGRRPFQHATAAETMAAVISNDPPELSAAPPRAAAADRAQPGKESRRALPVCPRPRLRASNASGGGPTIRSTGSGRWELAAPCVARHRHRSRLAGSCGGANQEPGAGSRAADSDACAAT
jgi:serine/threonine protein kinase